MKFIWSCDGQVHQDLIMPTTTNPKLFFMSILYLDCLSGLCSDHTAELCRRTTMKRSRHHSSSEDSDNGSKQKIISPDLFIPSTNADLDEVCTILSTF